MNAIIPSRITEAREARAMSMGDLANSINVTRQAISKYEHGISSPSPDKLHAIALRLNFPIDFFYKEEVNSTAHSSALFFRSNSNIAKKVKAACKYQVKWIDELRCQLSKYVDFIDRDFTTINENYDDLTMDDIEQLALDLRQKWGLSDDPIQDLVGVLENHGIIISRFPSNKECPFKGIDAFSSWKNGTPYILYHEKEKSAVRTRFSLLHELGHLILHSSISIEDAVKKDVIELADAQADRFAAAMLLPLTSFPKDIHGTSIKLFISVKRKWGVALSTIIKRCSTLGLLSENQINYLKKQMTLNNYWRKEPLDDEMICKGPEIIRDAIYLLIDNEIITKDAFVRSVSLSINDLCVIGALPHNYFNLNNNRPKPILRVLR